jgi:hypothetical protein
MPVSALDQVGEGVSVNCKNCETNIKNGFATPVAVTATNQDDFDAMYS